jgi:hypothetical protein
LNEVSSGGAKAAEIGGRLDEAIALFRQAMPGRGLKLIVPPPLTNGSLIRVSLSAWRRGDESARVHSGNNIREAVEILFDWETAVDYERRRQRDCPHCRGVGWYIAQGGARTICTHS